MGIIAYDIKKAKKEFKKGRDPLDLSIEKWENIERVLKSLKLEIKATCGLCFKYRSSNCIGCPLFEGMGNYCIDKQMDGINRAVVYANVMVEKLKSLRK